MQLFYSQSIENNSLSLDEEEYRHCIKVLRHSVGDEIAVTDGKGTLYKALIAQVGKHQCTATIVQQQHFHPVVRKQANQRQLAFERTAFCWAISW